MIQLLEVLAQKAQARGGEAIVAATFSLTHGTSSDGVRKVRLTGVGTVVARAAPDDAAPER